MAKPSPEGLDRVVKSLQPTIDYALNSIQSSDDPVLRTRARLLAGKAIQSYQPDKGAGLHTWVTQQLQQLHRMKRQTSGPVKLPDRAVLDNMAITRAEKEFLDQRGRDPDMEELSDFAKIPIKRIQTVRRLVRKMPSESALGAEIAPGLGEAPDPLLDEAMDYIYRDADKLDRRILELKTGYNGNDPLPPWQVAKALGLTATQLSRRSARLHSAINRTHSDLLSVYAQ